ncbi:uncharacterized protein LOC115761210 [Drosophila novamexicana]|uniref:uncharacterized protein LOC115761210 n=1 Tax=Drosophila novamexicana TaxID=47314 RepID=UPI0011E6083E|nr:uncharacterized protein LOC115761210 [Drosophila novamexicana]
MQLVIFFTILLGLSSLSAQPLNMNLLKAMGDTLNDNQMNNVLPVPSTIANPSDELLIDQSKSDPISTTTLKSSSKIRTYEVYAVNMTHKKVTTLKPPKSNCCNSISTASTEGTTESLKLNSSITISTTSTEGKIFDNRQSITTETYIIEPRPMHIEPRLSVKLLKVLTLLG